MANICINMHMRIQVFSIIVPLNRFEPSPCINQVEPPLNQFKQFIVNYEH